MKAASANLPAVKVNTTFEGFSLRFKYKDNYVDFSNSLIIFEVMPVNSNVVSLKYTSDDKIVLSENNTKATLLPFLVKIPVNKYRFKIVINSKIDPEISFEYLNGNWAVTQ